MKYLFLFILLLINALNPTYAAIKKVFGTTEQEIKIAIHTLNANGKTVKTVLSDFFNQKEQLILQKIKHTYGISQKKWNSMKMEVDQLILNDPLFHPTSNIAINHYEHWIIKEARSLIALYGMNVNNVIITENTQIPAAQVIAEIDNGILIHRLELNIHYLETLTFDQCIHTLKHEIMHLWYEDSVNASALLDLIDNNTLDPLYVEYSKNQELRADIMAAIESSTDAGNYYNWLISSEPNSIDDFIHPTLDKRIKAGLRLYNYLYMEEFN